jgi:hypothetical protein
MYDYQMLEKKIPGTIIFYSFAKLNDERGHSKSKTICHMKTSPEIP